MPGIVTSIIAVVALLVGAAAGFLLNRYVVDERAKKAADEAQALLKEAEKQAEAVRKEKLLEAKEEIYKMKQQNEAESRERRKEIKEL